MSWIRHFPATGSGVTTRSGSRLLAIVLVLVAVTPAWAGIYEVVVDDASRPLPGPPPHGWYFNATGGDRGCIGSTATTNVFTMPKRGVYRAECVGRNDSPETGFVGFWEGLNRPIAQRQAFRPRAMFHPLIRPEYQGRLLGVEVTVIGVASPAATPKLTLAVELKGWDAAGRETVRSASELHDRTSLLDTPFPHTFWFPLNRETDAPIGVLAVLLRNAAVGDRLEIGSIRLRVGLAPLDPKLEPFLFAYANLLNAYDEATGLVQDRANYVDRIVENVTATGKLAKLIAVAIELGVTDRAAGGAAIDQIATTLLTRLPHGPAGLWPHFTTAGGTIPARGSEWSSGDTAYTLLDLMVALRMIGDPHNQLPYCQTTLEHIDWRLLARVGSGYSHGFASNGAALEGTWVGFGMETLGVNLAAIAAGSPVRTMRPPASDNGSGFILHAGYPILPSSVDRWGNNWMALRRAEVAAQRSWYLDARHANPFFASHHWFGLSAAERPAGWDANPAAAYAAYGLGGRTGPAEDDNDSVIVPHYSGMVAALVPDASLAMWNSLRDGGLMSPMNFAESIAVTPTTAALEQVNFLKSSWNLALFAEGWALANSAIETKLKLALLGVPTLANAWRELFPGAISAGSDTLLDELDLGPWSHRPLNAAAMVNFGLPPPTAITPAPPDHGSIPTAHSRGSSAPGSSKALPSAPTYAIATRDYLIVRGLVLAARPMRRA